MSMILVGNLIWPMDYLSLSKQDIFTSKGQVHLGTNSSLMKSIFCRKNLGSVVVFIVLGSWFLMTPVAAQPIPAPRWTQLQPQQQAFLIEAFNLGEAQKASFADSIPNEIKQSVLDAMWNLLTPEKRVQVLLYAHIERPFGTTANENARSLAPDWNSLSRTQKARAFEAFRFDQGQRALFEAAPNELKQSAFETLWSYLSPVQRKGILSKI